MQKRAEPPQEPLPPLPPWITRTYASSSDEILQWLHDLPESSHKEIEKARLLSTRFRDLLPSRRAGRPPAHDLAAVALVIEAPLLQKRLRAVKQALRRRPRLEQHGLVSKPAGRETTEEHIQRIAPVVLAAWREHREALWPFQDLTDAESGEGSPQDPPEAVLVGSIHSAIARQKQRNAPDLAELAARLLAWRWGVSPHPRAIRKLIERGVALRKVGPRKGLRKDSYF